MLYNIPIKKNGLQTGNRSFTAPISDLYKVLNITPLLTIFFLLINHFLIVVERQECIQRQFSICLDAQKLFFCLFSCIILLLTGPGFLDLVDTGLYQSPDTLTNILEDPFGFFDGSFKSLQLSLRSLDLRLKRFDFFPVRCNLRFLRLDLLTVLGIQLAELFL